jgi:hypothetical protein
MAARARRAASDGAESVNGSLEAQECCTVICFEMPPRRVDTLTSRNDNYVYSCQWFTGLKQFPDPPFGAVSDHRVPDLLTGCDAQA